MKTVLKLGAMVMAASIVALVLWVAVSGPSDGKQNGEKPALTRGQVTTLLTDGSKVVIGTTTESNVTIYVSDATGGVKTQVVDSVVLYGH